MKPETACYATKAMYQQDWRQLPYSSLDGIYVPCFFALLDWTLPVSIKYRRSFPVISWATLSRRPTALRLSQWRVAGNMSSIAEKRRICRLGEGPGIDFTRKGAWREHMYHSLITTPGYVGDRDSRWWEPWPWPYVAEEFMNPESKTIEIKRDLSRTISTSAPTWSDNFAYHCSYIELPSPRERTI